MAHYAFLDENNVVTEVIPGRHEDEVVNGISDWETYYGNIKGQTCVRTSFNANIRKKFAQPGDTYDPELDAFIPEKPFPSWVLNEEEWDWYPPIPRPTEGFWVWDEESLSFIEVSE